MKKSTDALLRIGTATPESLPQLLALYEHLAADNIQMDFDLATKRLAAFHAIAGSAVFVGYSVGKLVCSCALAIIPNLTRSGKPYGLIENVVTHRDYRGLGFGKQVLSHAIEHAWHHDCYKVMLLTGSQKPETHAFYRSAGFEASKTGYQIRRISPRAD